VGGDCAAHQQAGEPTRVQHHVTHDVLAIKHAARAEEFEGDGTILVNVAGKVFHTLARERNINPPSKPSTPRLR